MNSSEVLVKFKGDTSSLDSSTKSAQTSLGKLAGAFTIGGLATKGISKLLGMFNDQLDDSIVRIDTMDNFSTVMQNLGISAEDSKEVIQDLSEELVGLPTTLNSAASSVQRLTSYNGDIKKSEDYFLAMNNAIIAGTNDAGMQATAMEQLTQAYTKGKPDMQDWKALLQAMPAQLKQVAQALGYPKTDQLYEALKNGEVSMDDFMDTLVQLNKKGVGEFASLEEQARANTAGIGTSVANMRTAFTRGVAGIVKSVDGALEPFGGLSGVITNIGKVGEKVFTEIGKVVGDIIPILLELGKEIMPTIKSSVKAIMPVIQKLAKALLPAIMKVVQKLIPAISKIIQAVLPIVVSLLDAIIPLLDPIANYLMAFIDYAMVLIDPLLQIMQVILPPIISMISNLAQVVLPMITGVLKGVTTAIKTTIDFIKGTISTTIEVIKAIITPIIEFIKLIMEGIKMVITPIIEFMQGVFNNIVNGVKTFINNVKNFILPIINWLRNSVLNPVVNVIKTVLNTAWNVIKNIFNGIKNTISTVFNFVRNNIISPLVGFFSSVFGTIKSSVETVFNGIRDVISNIFNGLVSIVKAPLNLIIDAINAVIGGLNKISIKIPKWVPKFGGKKWGINIGKIPKLEVGTNYVPEDTLAMIHEGEAVIPKKFNPYANMNNSMLGVMKNTRQQQVINVYASFKQDSLGQTVRNIKTFSGGARNDYNYGVGV